MDATLLILTKTLLKKIIFLSVIFSSLIVFAQKDTLKLRNGNMLIGEIKGMDKSVLTYKTPYSDKDFKIKWHEVAEIYSNRYFIISLENGKRFSSTINSVADKKGIVYLDAGMSSFEDEIHHVIYLDPIGKSYLGRLTLDVDVGITITKSNNYKQFTTTFSGSYVADKWQSSTYFNSVLTRQDGIEDLTRVEGNIDLLYYLPSSWFLQTEAEYLGNDEQKLDLRSTYKVGGGYFFKRNNDLYFGGGTGVAFNYENYSDDSPDKQSTELYAGMAYNKYDIGDISFLSNFVYYYSLTEDSRYRVDFSVDLKYDLPHDFYIKANLTYNFDSQPIEGASKDDYITQLSFGWEFN